MIRASMGFYAERLFPLLHDVAVRSFHRYRRDILVHATGRVLELGMGSGMNLAHYDPARVAVVTGIEPSAGMRKRAEARAGALGLPVEIAAGSAEALPYPDAAFDTVVATLVLCTVPDVEVACREAFRVLKPGGRYLAIEHVRDPDPRVARWQARLTPLQRVLAVGCHLDRDTGAALARAGFDLRAVETRPSEGWAPSTVRMLLRGVALRPA